MGIRNGRATAENSLAVSHSNKHILTIWPSNPTPTYVSNDMKTYIYTEMFRQMLMWALLVITKHWAQHKCSSTVEQSRQTFHVVHVTECYSAIGMFQCGTDTQTDGPQVPSERLQTRIVYMLGLQFKTFSQKQNYLDKTLYWLTGVVGRRRGLPKEHHKNLFRR